MVVTSISAQWNLIVNLWKVCDMIVLKQMYDSVWQLSDHAVTVLCYKVVWFKHILLVNTKGLGMENCDVSLLS